MLEGDKQDSWNDIKLSYYSKWIFLHNCSDKVTLMIMSYK